MGDSTTMTIEFLRARLLSERSVSGAARQRADQLAKRVMELEEQLRAVAIQRKKAEKAAAEVLAILETQGIGDMSDAVYSSSDGEPCDSLKEYESSTASRMEKSEVEYGLSGSEPEVSPSQGRSLSWKSHENRTDSLVKERAKQIRQRQKRRSFISTLQSSLKHEMGKSCRKIKRKDVGSSADSETQKPTLLDTQENGGATCSNYCDDQLKSRDMMEEAVADTSVSHHFVDHNNQSEVHPRANGNGIDEEMERVLEKQAMLIVQFQAEENAQREWEDKYNENKTPSLADYESGNQPNIPEKSSQAKEFSALPGITPGDNEEAKLEIVNISSTEEPTVESLSGSGKNDRSGELSNMVLSTSSTSKNPIRMSTGNHFSAWGNDLAAQSNDSTTAKVVKPVLQEFSVAASDYYGTTKNGSHNGMLLHDVSNDRLPSNIISNHHGNRILEDTSLKISLPIDDLSCVPKSESQQNNQVQLRGQLPQAPSSSLGGVLEALQRAKLSLNQELSKRPSSGHATLALEAATNSPTRAIASNDGLKIPMDSASLFRLPTDSFPPSLFASSELYAPRLSIPPNRFPYNRYAVDSYGHQIPPTSQVEAGIRIGPDREYFNNYAGASMGMPGSNRYSRASSDLSAERTSSRGELSKSYSDLRSGMPPVDRYAFYGGDHTRL